VSFGPIGLRGDGTTGVTFRVAVHRIARRTLQAIGRLLGDIDQHQGKPPVGFVRAGVGFQGGGKVLPGGRKVVGVGSTDAGGDLVGLCRRRRREREAASRKQ
jgi:hypothetical protein